MSNDAYTAAAAARTVGDGRAVLGVVTEVLAQAYTEANNAPWLASRFGMTQVLRDRVDNVNAAAGRHYAALSGLDDAAPLTPQQHAQVQLDAQQAEDVLDDIEAEWGSEFWDLGSQITTVLVESGKTFSLAASGLVVAALAAVVVVLIVKSKVTA